MRIFDRIDPLKLEQRDSQLWVFAIAIIVIFASGIALLLYPAAFSKAVAISGPAMRKIFFSFCALSALLVGYLVERQIAIRNLRRWLFQEKGRNARLLRQASIELLQSLPNLDHFQDRLSMEFRRAAIARQPFSVIAVALNPRKLAEGDEVATAFGDAAKVMIRTMGREDSLYLFRPGGFGIILPAASAEEGTNMVGRLAWSLEDLAGPHQPFTAELKMINYPDDVSTARDMENLAVRAFPSELPAARVA